MIKKKVGAVMIGVLRRAAESKEKIQIMYMAGDGGISQRYVTVININDTHVICYCHFRKQRRMFKLDNILAASPIYKKRSI
ncbi:WYL domain-containing protein [bacterium LRH843]|nr:WYL domain-containing protein [bacterium LRH843]